MTLIIQVNQRTVAIAVAKGETILQSLDATWQNGNGRPFTDAVSDLLSSQLSDVKSIRRVIVSVSHPSFTTIRTVLAFVNTFVWVRPVELFELPESFASEKASQLVAESTKDYLVKKSALFPSYV